MCTPVDGHPDTDEREREAHTHAYTLPSASSRFFFHNHVISISKHPILKVESIFEFLVRLGDKSIPGVGAYPPEYVQVGWNRH